jgi:outer membrane protein assembly factor BamB
MGVGISAPRGIWTPTEKWSNPIGLDFSWESTIGNFTGNIIGATNPVISVAYAESGEVNIVDGYDGATMWSLNVDLLDADLLDRVLTAPALADFDEDGRTDIAFATNDGMVYVYEPKIEWDGDQYSWNTSNTTRLMNYDTGGIIRDSSPVIANIAGSNAPDLIIGAGGTVHALDIAGGQQLWEFSPTGTIIATPAVYTFGTFNRTVVVSASDSAVYLDILDHRGVSVWSTMMTLSTSTPGVQAIQLLPSPVIAELDGDTQNGVEIVVLCPFQNNDGVIAVYNPLEKKKLWEYSDIEGQFDASPAVGDIDGDGDTDIVAVA